MFKHLQRLVVLIVIAAVMVMAYQEPLNNAWDKLLKDNTPTILKQNISPVKTVKPDKMDSRKFDWHALHRDWSWTIALSQTGYEFYKKQPRIPTDDYSVYVTNTADDAYLTNLVMEFRDAKASANLSEWQMIDLVVAFVQSIPYVDDKAGTGLEEYPKYPIETLYEQSGDCEDKSILMASLLDRLGYGAVLLVMPNHMAVGVKGATSLPGTYVTYQGNRYYYLETTSEDWQIGDVPSEMEKSKAKILPLLPKPVLTHRWESKGGLINNRVKVTVNNQGTGNAANTAVYVSFDAEGQKVYSQITSQTVTIPPGHQLDFNVALRYPHRVKTRLHVKVVIDGVLDSESTSEWFNTK